MFNPRVRSFPASIFGVALLAGVSLLLGAGVRAAPARTGREQAPQPQARQPASQPLAQPQSQGPVGSDADREEQANFQQFLASHPIMKRELESNPSLANDPHYVQSEPDLGIYLSHHPNIKTELQRNPSDLLQSKYAGNEANRGGGAGATPRLNSTDVGFMNAYLDQHKDVDQQLKQNPALIDDANFLGQHQDLRALLNQHPEIRTQFEQDPAYFTHPEWRSAGAPAPTNVKGVNSGSSRPNLDSNKPNSTRANPQPTSGMPPGAVPMANGMSEINVQEVARLQQFFEDHADIARQLEAHPTLVTDHKYLDKHKDVRRFFYEHVKLREAFVENPRYFTRRGDAADASSPLSVNTQATNSDLVQMEKFLEKHKDIAKELARNPVSGVDPRYLSNHKDLRRFFDEHAQIQLEFDHDPRYFMQRESEIERQGNAQRTKH